MQSTAKQRKAKETQSKAMQRKRKAKQGKTKQGSGEGKESGGVPTCPTCRPGFRCPIRHSESSCDPSTSCPWGLSCIEPSRACGDARLDTSEMLSSRTDKRSVAKPPVSEGTAEPGQKNKEKERCKTSCENVCFQTTRQKERCKTSCEHVCFQP